MDINERWESLTDDGGEYLEFDRVENRLSSRRDIHAFILLNNLFPGDGDIVCSAGHDQIWLDASEENVESLTDEQIIELSRCGVMLDDGMLSMFA